MHLKGSDSQGSIVSEFLIQSRDSDNDDYEKSMVGRHYKSDLSHLVLNLPLLTFEKLFCDGL